MSQDDNDLLPTERVGTIVYVMADNVDTVFTTAELAAMVGLKHQSMWTMLCKLSRALPIVQEPKGQGWRMIDHSFNGGG